MLKNSVLNHNRLFHLLLAMLGGVVLLFIVGPLLGMVLATTPSQLFEAAQETEVRRSIGLTLWVSMAATIVFALAAVPFSWLLARKDFRFKQLISGIIDLPIVIPHSAAGIAVLGFISRDSVLGKMASSVGIDLVGNPAGIALAMAFVSVPFLINAARDGFAVVPERLEKAALNLGASHFRVFMSISLPLAWRSVLSGFVMMFARGMSEFGAVIIVAYHPMIAPVMIYERFSAFGLAYARPVAVLFLAVCLVFFVTLRLFTNKIGRHGNPQAR
jgi:molybdate/tungstate transport system permease protein